MFLSAVWPIILLVVVVLSLHEVIFLSQFLQVKPNIYFDGLL